MENWEGIGEEEPLEMEWFQGFFSFWSEKLIKYFILRFTWYNKFNTKKEEKSMGKNDDSGFGVLFGLGALIGLFGFASYKSSKATTEVNRRRREMPIKWTDGLSEEVFETFCRKSAKEIKRLKIISVDGLYVRCEVKSSSGISTWEFSADFYDYGNLSGSYFIGYKENDDSTIPKVFLEKVARRIREITYNYDVATPLSSMDLNGLNVDEVKQLFYNSGYLSVHTTSKEKGLFKLFSKNGTVSEVSIDGVSEFSKGQIFRSGSFVNRYCQ